MCSLKFYHHIHSAIAELRTYPDLLAIPSGYVMCKPTAA